MSAGGSHSCRNLSRALDAQTRIHLGSVSQSVEPARWLHNEYDVSHYSQAGLLEPRSHGEDRPPVLPDMAQGSTQAQREFALLSQQFCMQFAEESIS